MPSCWSWTSLVLPLSLLPTRVLSLGWLKSLISLTSTRNSPVKTLVSIGDSVVRLFPFSQVKSANAKGSGALGFAAASAAGAVGAVGAVVVGTVGAVGGVGVTAGGFGAGGAVAGRPA